MKGKLYENMADILLMLHENNSFIFGIDDDHLYIAACIKTVATEVSIIIRCY